MSSLLSTPKPPQSIIISYLTLRKVIGFLSMLLVPVLIIGSLVLDCPKEIKDSISAYYYGHMRNVFVGTLCGISLFLFSYHGYTRKDSIASKLAALFALGIAFFPTSETEVGCNTICTVHYISAGAFFVVLSYMSIFLFTKTSGNMTAQKKMRNRVYRVCGIIMAASALCILLSKIPAIRTYVSSFKPILVFETLALVSFGVSWLTKGEFLLKDK